MSNGSTLEVDLHVHSKASYDGREPIDLLLEHAADIGLDGIAITDHDVISASVEAAERAADYGLIGIPGVEISTKEGHLLGIGITQRPPARQSMADTISTIRALGGVAIVPHPFQRTRHGIKKRHLRQVNPDAIETFNAWLFTGYRNRHAKQYARLYGFPGVGGSDAHSLRTVGRSYTKLHLNTNRNQVTVDHIVTAIQKGATNIVGHRASLSRSSAHYTKAFGRKTVWGAREATMIALNPFTFR